MKRRCLYRCPKCGTEETIWMRGVDRIVTCDNECTDDEGWRTVMKLIEAESDAKETEAGTPR